MIGYRPERDPAIPLVRPRPRLVTLLASGVGR
jgi:hypothetical protein